MREFRATKTKTGKLYINELDEITDDKIRIYDKNKKYLDYFELDMLKEIANDRKMTIGRLFDSCCETICNCNFMFKQKNWEIKE